MDDKPAVYKLLLSKRDAAQALSLSVRTIENLIRSKELPVRKLGRRRLIPFSALEVFARADHPSPVRAAEVAVEVVV
jgi:excisionase family DNA binding protein